MFSVLVKMKLNSYNPIKIFIIVIIIIYFFHSLKGSKPSFCLTWTNNLRKIKIESNKDFNYHTLRQVFQVSIGSSKLRLKFSNMYGNTPLEILSGRIALTNKEDKININSNTNITFKGGKEKITIRPKKEVYSDIINFNTIPLQKVTISIYLGKAPTKQISGHIVSLTNSYFFKGNHVDNKEFIIKNEINENIRNISKWYFLHSIEVLDENNLNKKKIIVCFGDSITDGSQATSKENSYPSFLNKRLIRNSYKNKQFLDYSIINNGFSGSRVMEEGDELFRENVLRQKEVKYVIFNLGINDILVNAEKAELIIQKYKKWIKYARGEGIVIYGSTITPFRGYKDKYTPKKEEERNKINSWIRKAKPSEGGFDGVIDFDKAVRNPKNISIINTKYDCGDHLHMSNLGYRKMAKTIKIFKLFK